MQWEMFPHEDGSGDWVVEGINIANEGEIVTTICSGSYAESRANEFYLWKNPAAQKAA
jgi:hypothetical protein